MGQGISGNDGARATARWTVVLGLLLAFPVGLAAQDLEPPAGGGEFSVFASGGVALPAGELADIVDAGASFGGGMSYRVGGVFGVWGGVDYQFLSGGDVASATFADMDILHAGGGVEISVVNAEAPFFSVLRVGGGLSSLDTEAMLDDGQPAPARLGETHPSLQGAFEGGYQATPHLGIFMAGRFYLMVLDRPDTQAFASLSPDITPFDTAWSIPLHVGVRITFGA